MNWNAASLDNLRRLFAEGFTAGDIAEPLASLDASTPAAEAHRLMEARDYDALGVRRDGLVVGYLDRNSARGGSCGDHRTSFDDRCVIFQDAPLAEVILGLAGAPRLFVRVLGGVGGIVTRSDLQKPAVRMWLFGIITLVEMRMSRLVELGCEGESWRAFLSEGRLQKAEALLEERRRRSQQLRLVDCLQFSDKAQIVARCESLRQLTRFTSRRQVEESCRVLEGLRNNLAHTQDIIASDWETIVLLAGNLDGAICGTPQVQDALAGKRQVYTVDSLEEGQL